ASRTPGRRHRPSPAPSRSPDSAPSGPARRPPTPPDRADLPERPGNGPERTTAARGTEPPAARCGPLSCLGALKPAGKPPSKIKTARQVDHAPARTKHLKSLVLGQRPTTCSLRVT